MVKWGFEGAVPNHLSQRRDSRPLEARIAITIKGHPARDASRHFGEVHEFVLRTGGRSSSGSGTGPRTSPPRAVRGVAATDRQTRRGLMRAASRYAYVGMVTTTVLALAAVSGLHYKRLSRPAGLAPHRSVFRPRAAPRTLWGEPDLSGSGKGINARTHNLQVLEGLYRPEVMAEMRKRAKRRSAAAVRAYGIPRAYLSVPWPRQMCRLLESSSLTEYYHAYRVIPTEARHTPKASIRRTSETRGPLGRDTLVVE